jgi:hypothetical protein
MLKTFLLLHWRYMPVWVLASSMTLLHRLWTFHNSRFGQGDVVSPTLNPNLEDQGLHFVWHLPFHLPCLVALPIAYAPASIALRVIGARKSPLHDKASVFEKVNIRSEWKLEIILFGHWYEP